jgi:hypothetical protein
VAAPRLQIRRVLSRLRIGDAFELRDDFSLEWAAQIGEDGDVQDPQKRRTVLQYGSLVQVPLQSWLSLTLREHFGQGEDQLRPGLRTVIEVSDAQPLQTLCFSAQQHSDLPRQSHLPTSQVIMEEGCRPPRQDKIAAARPERPPFGARPLQLRQNNERKLRIGRGRGLFL